MESFLSQNSASLTTNLSPLADPIAFSAPFYSTPSSSVDSLSPSTSAASLPSIPTRTLPLDAGVINIVNYGAIPNDGKDDTVAIQKVLDDNDGDRRRVSMALLGLW